MTVVPEPGATSDLQEIASHLRSCIRDRSRRRIRPEDVVRIVLERVRDPTPAMENAFHAACDEHGQVLWRHGYRAMINALLKEET